MKRRYQQRSSTCGSLALMSLLLIIVLIQWTIGRRTAPTLIPLTPTATPTFISREAIAVLPTNTPYISFPDLPTFTPTPTLSPTPTLTPTPIPTATFTPTPEPTLQATVAVSLIYLRSGPDAAYPEKVILGEGEELTIIGRNTAGDWFQVRLINGMEGWVFADLVSPVFGAEILPIRTPLPLP